MAMHQTPVIETDVAIIGAGTAGTAGMSAYRAALAHTPRVGGVAKNLDWLRGDPQAPAVLDGTAEAEWEGMLHVGGVGIPVEEDALP